MVTRTFIKDQTMSNAPKSSLRDHLTTTTDAGKIDLTEQELSRVTGGILIRNPRPNALKVVLSD